MTEQSSSAGGIVVGPDGAVALTFQDGVVWSLPKGRLEPGEDNITAARREIAEETGLTDLKLIEELGTYSRYKISRDGKGEDESVLKTITIFLFSTSQKDLKPTDPAHSEARWVEPEKVTELLSSPKDQEFYKSVQHKVEEFINKK